MSDEIKIENGVPLPKPRAQNRKYPFNEMQVGDSFFVGLDGYTPEEAVNRVCSAARYGARMGRDERFTCRAVEGGVRVWRVK